MPAKRTQLATLVEDMRRWGMSPALVEHRGVRRYTTSYGALTALALRVAAELERRGIGPGERVVLWGANSAAWIAVYFGCVLRGVLPVPLDAAGDPAFAASVVREVRPRWIAGDRNLLRRLGPEILSGLEYTELDRLENAFPQETAASLPITLGPDSPLQIIFTSGTTGTPKGVVHTHRNLLASLRPIEREIAKYRRYERWVHPLRFLHTLPLSHVFGQFMGLWVPPLLGATVVYEDRLTAGRLLGLIAEERVHVLAAVPRTLGLLRAQMLATEPRLAAELGSAAGETLGWRWWRFRRVHRTLGPRFWAAVCGGATLPQEVEAFWTGLGFARIQGYGLTETAALVTLNHPFQSTRGSLGKPLPGRVLRIAENGELLVRGEMVSTATWQGGRLQQQPQSAAHEGWLATGDLASIGEDGRVQFLGRTGQRLVTAAGLNVYLEDVEQALHAEPELGGAIVFPMASGDGGEEPAAVLLTQGGRQAAASAVEHANQSLAPHQQVRRWWLWPGLAFPRTASGKVQRRTVAAWAEKQSDAPGANRGAPSGEEDPVLRLLDSLGRRRGPVTDETRLTEGWGLDSMGRVALAVMLEEELGLELGDSRLATAQNLGDLRRLLRPTGTVPRTGAITPPRAGNGSPPRSQPLAPIQSPLAGKAGAPYRYPRWPWSPPVRLLRALFTEALLRPLVRLLGAPRIERDPGTAAYAKPGTAPMLLIANHRTAMDVPLLLYALPRALRGRVAVAMSGEMLAGWQRSWSLRPLPAALAEHRRWWGPIAAFLLQALLNVFPLPRTIGFRESFRHAGRALDHGYNVLLFPEGRRAQEEVMLPFKPGLGLLAQEAHAALLPMALRIWKEKQARPAIVIGKPVRPELDTTPEQVTAQLEATVRGMLASGAGA